MKLVDANVLIYAFNQDSERHLEARAWLDRSLSGQATVGFSWVALLAFVRLTTKPGLFPQPVSSGIAMAQVTDWLAQPSARLLQPTERHSSILDGLLAAAGTGGNLVNDAHLAALAIEHRAEIVSYDSDFSRFSGVRWHRPD